MNFKNNKGISLVEVLIASAILAIVMPMITSILINSVQDYVSGTNFIGQQDKINNIYQVIRNDQQRCREIIAEKTVAIGDRFDTIEFKYDSKDMIQKEPWDIDDIINKKFEFIDDPDTDEENDEDVLRLTNSQPATPVVADILDNIDVRPLNAAITVAQKSGFYYKSVSASVFKIWIEIWFRDINTQFFKSRNYSAPVVIYFDTSNKEFSHPGL